MHNRGQSFSNFLATPPHLPVGGGTQDEGKQCDHRGQDMGIVLTLIYVGVVKVRDCAQLNSALPARAGGQSVIGRVVINPVPRMPRGM